MWMGWSQVIGLILSWLAVGLYTVLVIHVRLPSKLQMGL